MEFAKNASKLHIKVYEALTSNGLFKTLNLRQEVPVSELFTNYNNNRDRYDWVIPEYSLIIECHGKQHYELSTFGGDTAKAEMNFITQKFYSSSRMSRTKKIL